MRTNEAGVTNEYVLQGILDVVGRCDGPGDSHDPAVAASGRELLGKCRDNNLVERLRRDTERTAT